MNNKLFLLDAYALIYRAYFAFSRNPRMNSNGINTSAIFGFALSLLDVLKKEKPDYIAVVFDSKAATVRHEMFPEYKANRERMPEDIAIAIPYIKEIISGFNIPIIAKDGYEADDIIGTLAKKAEKEGLQTFMMTPDKDFGQLVSENIFMYKPARMGNGVEIWGVEEVCKKFDIDTPEKVIDILGLWGDASDNIPGIPGIGEKTSKKLIKEFGSLEGIIENSDKLKGKQRENVENFAEQGILSKKLATIILDAPVEFNTEELKFSDINSEKLKTIFTDLEFRTLFPRLLEIDSSISMPEEKPVEKAPASKAKPQNDGQLSLFDQNEEYYEEKKYDNIENVDHNYILVESDKDCIALAEKLNGVKEFSFDTETTGLNIIDADLVGFSFSIKKKEGYYVAVSADFEGAKTKVQLFKTVLENPEILKIGQNLKYDISVLSKYDIDVKGPIFDTMIAHYLLEPDMRHNMDFLSQTYLNYNPVSITSLIGPKGKNQGNMRNVEIGKIKEYACEDADITLQLKEILAPKLKETETEELFNNIEMPLVSVLSKMECNGINIDDGTLKELSKEFTEELVAIEDAIHEMADEKFNVSSPKQLGVILFEKLKIDSKVKKTKTKQYSTSEETLQKLTGKHPIIEKILEYRSLKKLLSTYIDSLPLLINKKTNRVHASFNQAVAGTGRLSSSNPNMQNIPIRTERGKEVRKAFTPACDDCILLAADYSQIELRIIAAVSQDESMIQAFNEGVDIHAATASKVFDVALDDVDSDMRRKAKTVNFGIIYGISAFGLSQRLSVPRTEAAELISQYFEKYPKIKEYMDNTILEARENGYVKTKLGRRRYLRDINSNNATVRGYSERNAINAPIQGFAADIIKVAMIDIQKEFEKENLKSKMIIQVHDELVFEVEKSELEKVKSIIEDKMTNAVKIDVPLSVDMGLGENWFVAH